MQILAKVQKKIFTTQPSKIQFSYEALHFFENIEKFFFRQDFSSIDEWCCYEHSEIWRKLFYRLREARSSRCLSWQTAAFCGQQMFFLIELKIQVFTRRLLHFTFIAGKHFANEPRLQNITYRFSELFH